MPEVHTRQGYVRYVSSVIAAVVEANGPLYPNRLIAPISTAVSEARSASGRCFLSLNMSTHWVPRGKVAMVFMGVDRRVSSPAKGPLADLGPCPCPANERNSRRNDLTTGVNNQLSHLPYIFATRRHRQRKQSQAITALSLQQNYTRTSTPPYSRTTLA